MQDPLAQGFANSLAISGPVSGSAGNKERLLLRTAPKGNPRSTLFALPQPESRRRLNCGRSLRLFLIRGDRGFESPILQRRVSNELFQAGEFEPQTARRREDV